MKKVMMVMLMVCFATIAFAQKITGTIQDADGNPVDKTTVSLLNAKDSSLVKIFVTDNTGKYNFDVQPGKYLLRQTHVGFTPSYSSAIDVLTDVEMGNVKLIKAPQSLSAVVVTSKKPMVEVEADKTILNVEGTINATGNDALELLRKAPGVVVDKDDNLSLAGKNGVQVYIDGKPSPLAGADLAAYLKTVQAAQVESIELITNPSAKYEAAGNAGIINIKLKKNKTFGTNGSVNAGYNIGIYSKYNTGLALNYRNKKINLFGNYNYNNSLNRNNFNLYRELLDTIFDQHAVMKNKSVSNGFKVGADYYMSKQSTLGVLINGNINTGDMNNNGVTNIIYKPTGVTDRLLRANNATSSDRNNANFNLNFRTSKKDGRELTVDADYGLYRIRTNQYQPNVYWNPAQTIKLSEVTYRFITPTNIDILSLKSDYEQNFKKGKLGVGVKIAGVKTDNNFGRYNVNNGVDFLDQARSNRFDYRENINAAYLNYNRGFKGFMVQAGVRAENTNLKGESFPLNADGTVNRNISQSFTRNYTNLFPSAAFTYNKNPKNQYSLSYSRRIDRPAYQDLNPFEMKLDEYTFQKGNINLRPQYSNIISLTNTYKFKLTSSLTYTHVNDMFTQLIDTADKSKTFISKQNLAQQDVFALNVSYPFSYKAYSIFANAGANYSKYKADFGGGNRVINLNVLNYNFYLQQSIKFGKSKAWTGEMSGFYTSPSVWQGTFKSSSIYSIDAGLQKTILKGKGTFKASVSDIFRTLKWRGESNFAGQQTIAYGSFESRQLRTSFTWRFGNAKVRAASQRKSAQEDEQKRTQGSGGIGGGQ